MPEREMPESEMPKSERLESERPADEVAEPASHSLGGVLAQPIAADQVAAYLRRHPDFLARHPDLLDVLALPSRERGEGVIDLQQFMVERLRREKAELSELRNDLVATGRSNLAIQSRVHEAILALLRATSFEEFVETITTDLAVILDLDVVTIGVERADNGVAWKPVAGVYCLTGGSIDNLLGRNANLLLRADVAGDPAIFDGAAGLVRSDALIRLAIGDKAPPALLALGSRQPGTFHAGQGTELLSFLSQVLEVSFRAWLHLPRDA